MLGRFDWSVVNCGVLDVGTVRWELVLCLDWLGVDGSCCCFDWSNEFSIKVRLS